MIFTIIANFYWDNVSGGQAASETKLKLLVFKYLFAVEVCNLNSFYVRPTSVRCAAYTF